MPVPLVDIAPFAFPKEHTDVERAQVAAVWDDAMRSTGFAQICGHGVPASDTAALREAAERFFKGSKEEKLCYCHGSYGSSGGGYTPAGTEAVGRTFGDAAGAPPDLVENYVFRGRPEQWGAGRPLRPHLCVFAVVSQNCLVL